MRGEPRPKPLVAITGASSGIGAALAEEFASAGHPVLAMARRGTRLAELDVDVGLRAEVDVRDSAAVRRAIEEAESLHGPVDLLVNNAGVMPLGRIEAQSPAEWQALFEINCMALLGVTQLVLPGMLRRGEGTIVNVSSIAGRLAHPPNHAAYSGTKAAVNAMTETLRREYADSGIRFQVLAPGLVETELVEGTSSDEIRSAYVATRARVGALEPAIVARAVRFAYELPQEVCMREIVVAPTAQAT